MKDRFTYFIGIDVSKNELDLAVQRGVRLLFHKEIMNQEKAISDLVEELKLLDGFMMSRAVFCMENTGVYNNILIKTLRRYRANMVQEHPLHIKMSMGNIRGKHDKIDSIRIARYGYRHRDELKLWSSRRKVILHLAELSSIRLRLVTTQTSLKLPLKEMRNFFSKSMIKESSAMCKRSLEGISKDIADIDAKILRLVDEDEGLKDLYKIVTSVPAVGMVTAVQIIITTNEFTDITTAKKFACYAGVAPFRNESGVITKRARVSPKANRRMKALLHMCAIGSLRCDLDLKNYFERKVKEGKPKMAVVNAIRFKLINRIFTCVHQQRLFTKAFQSAIPLATAIG